nr:uncharacterized protein LOC122322069 [Drosophila bipectinata]
MDTPEPHGKALAVDTLIDTAGNGKNMNVRKGNPDMNKNQLLLDMLKKKRQSEAKFIEEKYKILMRMNPADVAVAGMFRATDSPTIPEVISTLKMFFGRPEHILERMVEKVRRLAPPKDRLEALIEYALAVRNVCATMEACDLKAHLNNPMLVKELVDKLPNQHKLNWAMQPRDDRVAAVKAFSVWLYKIAEAASLVVAPSFYKTGAVNSHNSRRHQHEDKHDRTRSILKQLSSKFNRDRPQSHVSTHRDDNHGCQFFRIIPVKLHYGSRQTEIYAFLDEGSSVTLADASVFQRLGIQGQAAPMCLQWAAQTTRLESGSVKASVQISEVNCDKVYWLNNVQTVQNLALPRQTVNMKELCERFQHLKDLPLRSYSAQQTLLIGTNNWKLAVPRKIREGKWNEPIASKCMLGWSIQGSANPQRFIFMHHCDCDWQELYDDIKEHFNLDALVPRKLYSAEDELAAKILENTCQKKSGKYEVGLPWRGGIDKLSESRRNALKRLTCMRIKVSQEPDLYEKIDAQIRNLLDKGYAVKLSEDETSRENSRTWYLPIFIALNPNKPKKIRLVWDAAAKAHGHALNDYLLKGPDCLNPLIDVLLAFRVNKIAICGDIAEMFHRINIREEDMQAQRFLTKAATKKTPMAHYVDDFIESMRNEQEAIQITRQVIEVHRRGGFEIRTWSSNSEEVLKSFQDNGNAGTQKPVDFCATEKIFGMFWDPQNDIFKFICIYLFKAEA